MSKQIKTLYVNKKNIDINNIVQLGGKNKSSKTNEDEVEEEDYEEEERNEEEIDEEEIDDEEIEGIEEIEETDNIDEEEEEVDENDENIEDIDIAESDTESLEDNNNDTIDEKQSTNNNAKKCYQKYASIADEDLDLDEYFLDDPAKISKTSKLTKPFLSKYERVKIISIRSKQLAQGAKPLVKNIIGLSVTEIALLELKNKVIPLIIERPVPNVGIERWKLSELIIL